MRLSTLSILAALSAAPALAAPGDGRLYFATIVSPSVKIYLDGTLLDEIPSGNYEAFDVTPGTHTLRAVGADGATQETSVNFDPAQLADARGGRWWCVVSVPPNGASGIKLVTMPTKDCKEFVDAGN
jgi:hypothetical protein